MGAGRTFAVVNLGCKANQSDSQTIAAGLAARGFAPAPLDEAGLVVVSGCAVTAAAEGKGRGELSRARRRNPSAIVAVAGCLARLRGGALAAEKAADLVLDGLPGWAPADGGEAPPLSPRRSRPLLKVQDGCDRSCAYCVVPALRGPSRSLSPGRVLASLAAMMGAGAAEVALAGIHIGVYGADLSPRSSLEELLRAFLDLGLPGRVRLSSLEPGELSGGLLALAAGSGGRICPHIHLSLQSGSDRVLAAMGREGGAESFRRAVEAARAALPGAGIGADLIAGFPGETEAEFARTLALVEELEVPFVHAFPFSPRPGTRAAAWADDVAPAEKRARVGRLAAAGRTARARFLAGTAARQGDAPLEVVLEGGRDPATGRRRGRAGNYLTVLVEGAEGIPRGGAARVRVEGAAAGSLLGRARREGER